MNSNSNDADSGAPRAGEAEANLTDVLERRIKKAFWETFHKSGELWFDYLGDEDECEESTNEKWSEFIENLRSNAEFTGAASSRPVE